MTNDEPSLRPKWYGGWLTFKLASPGRSTRNLVALTCLLALASYCTTCVQWDGGFPSGEIRVDVRDAAGAPIEGAVLRVYRGGTRDLAFEYPLDNHVVGHGLVSDQSGRITAIRKNGGLQFGGQSWRLFWMIPMGARAPEFDCEIVAAGFEPLLFDIMRLFESPHTFYEDFPKTKSNLDGREIDMKIYQNTFVFAQPAEEEDAAPIEATRTPPKNAAARKGRGWYCAHLALEKSDSIATGLESRCHRTFKACQADVPTGFWRVLGCAKKPAAWCPFSSDPTPEVVLEAPEAPTPVCRIREAACEVMPNGTKRTCYELY